MCQLRKSVCGPLFGYFLTIDLIPIFSLLALTRIILTIGYIRIHKCLLFLIYRFGVFLCNRMTIYVSHRLSGFSLISAIEVMMWWMFHILSLKASLPSLYWIPSCESRLWWWPKCLLDGDGVVDYFHFWILVCILSNSKQLNKEPNVYKLYYLFLC